MLVGMYAIYDVKAGSYMSPFTLATDGMAKRAFINEMRRPDSLIGSSPSDFSLVKLGSFDDVAGTVSSDDPLDGACLLNGDEARYLMEEEGK